MEKLKNFTNGLDKTLVFFAISCLVISVIGAVISVFLRYIFGVSYQIIEEVSRYVIIYGTFLYIGPLIKSNQHLKMSILADYLRGRMKHVLDLLISLIMFGAFVFLLWSATIWVMSLHGMGIKTVSGTMMLYIPALAIPLGMLLGSLYSLQQMIIDIYSIINYKYLDKSEDPDDLTQSEVL